MPYSTFVFVSQMQALQSQLDFQEQSMVEKSLVSRQEAKIRELESKLEFEKTQVKRLEVSGKYRWLCGALLLLLLLLLFLLQSEMKLEHMKGLRSDVGGWVARVLLLWSKVTNTVKAHRLCLAMFTLCYVRTL